jgi:translation initiation factor IF-2
MAKIRVYELAKDLNMTNRALLNKMKELKIEVKSHMSSLEDSTVRAIRNALLGKKKSSTDVKIKPSVIRRRRKKPEAITRPGQDEESHNQDQKQTDTAPEQKPVSETKDAPKKVSDTKTSEKPAPQESGKEAEPAAKKEPRAEKPRLKPKAKKSTPAKIIKPAAPPEPEKPEESSSASVSAPVPQKAQPESAPVSESETQDSSTPEKALKQAVDKEDEIKKPEEEQGNKEIQQPVPPEPDQEDRQEKENIDNQENTRKKVKKKKKKKKSTPAKIVKIADPVVLENLRKSASADHRPHSGPGIKSDRSEEKRSSEPGTRTTAFTGIHNKEPRPSDIPMPVEPDAGKRKKEKRKHRKRKSVIEGDALYKSSRGKKKRGRKDIKGKKTSFQKTQITTPKAIKRRIKIDEAIELAELAKRMGIKANEMIVKLMGLGVMATVNQTIDFDTAALVAAEFGFEVEKASFEEEALLQMEAEEEDQGKMIARAPVVTIMGHVDHGKTSLLDVIRKSKITSGEAGGITQHIGAYNVETPNGGRITFLDTPGHAAFTAMRSRGAQVTDIVILVVAADDGVMPQTIEAINHSKAANVPVVVAVNKIDKAGADPDRIMRELSEFDLLPEEWGGDVIFVKVSAKTGEGIDELLEMVLLQSEVLELKANPDRRARGYVVESRLDTGRGAVATVLVKQGTLREGDAIVCGLHSGRIRAMMDDSGKRIKSAGPSTPAEIFGLNGVPDAGDELIAVASDKDAKQIATHRMQKQRAKELAQKSRANLEKIFENLGSAEIKELKLIVKADVQGSIEALNDSLKDLAKEEVDVKIVHSGVGTINESDVSLAGVSDAIIIGFNVRPSPQIRKLAKEENVDMRFYDIIYDVINDIKTALDGMMPSTFHEIIIGRAEVKETFVVPKIGTIAGCQVTEGKVIRGKKVRLLREGVIKCDTELSSLRRFKDDVREVEQGYECGIGLEKYNDIKVGDAIECYEIEERQYKAE